MVFRELRHAFTLVCNFKILEGVIDWKEVLGGALPTSGQVLSISQAYQFSVRKPEKPIGHAVQAEIFMSWWSDTDVHGPEHFMNETEAEKRFDKMESHILFLAAKFDFCANDIEKWVHTLRELQEKH
eukprot:jgi/Tetstr1/462945/TSEL_007893.t1